MTNIIEDNSKCNVARRAILKSIPLLGVAAVSTPVQASLPRDQRVRNAMKEIIELVGQDVPEGFKAPRHVFIIGDDAIITTYPEDGESDERSAKYDFETDSWEIRTK